MTPRLKIPSVGLRRRRGCKEKREPRRAGSPPEPSNGCCWHEPRDEPKKLVFTVQKILLFTEFKIYFNHQKTCEQFIPCTVKTPT